LEVCDRVKGALGPDTDCTITPAPADSLAAGASTVPRRKACKDVTSCEAERGGAGGASRCTLAARRCLFGCLNALHAPRDPASADPAAASNLRRIVGSMKSLQPGGSGSEGAAPKDSHAQRQEAVEVNADNETSPAHTLLTLRCRDRKGLLYDLFRALKDIDLR
jgi:hypothetical protein